MLSTDVIRHAMLQATEAAHSGGATEVTSHHLVVGLAALPSTAQHVLADLGLTPTVLRRAGDALFPPAPATGNGSQQRVPVAPEVKVVLEDAAQRAYASGRHLVTTADVLLAVAARPDSPGGRVLAAVPGRTGEGLHAAVAEHRSLGCCAEPGPNTLSDVLAEAGAMAPRLPGWASFTGDVAALLGAYAMVLATVISLTADTAGVNNVLTFFAAGLMVAVATTALATLRWRSREWLDEVAPDDVAVPPGLRTTLAAHGLTQVEVRLTAGAPGDRTVGGLRRAWIILSHAAVHDRAALPFVLWHELAYAARRDGARRWVADTFGYAVFLASVFTAEVSAAAAGALGVLLVRTANRWLSELACDRIAAAHAGAASARAWAVRARAASSRLARARALLSHPPVAWRLAWASRYRG